MSSVLRCLHASAPVVGVAVGIAVIGPSTPAHAFNLLTNGSFEQPSISNPASYLTGSTAINGWTVVGPQVDLINGGYTALGVTFNSQDGSQWLDLSGSSLGISSNNGVTQSITTTPGEQYVLSFYVGSAKNASTGVFVSTVDLSINGGARVSYTNPTTPTSSLDWLQFTVPYTATGTTTTLTFYNGTIPTSTNSNGDVTALDNVSFSAVPAPLPVLGAAAAFGWSRRLRKRLRHRGGVPSPVDAAS